MDKQGIGIEDIKKIIEEHDLYDRLLDLSYDLGDNLVDPYSSLYLTLWKDGNATLSLQRAGSDYDTFKSIKALIDLPRFLITGYLMHDELSQKEKDDAIKDYKANFNIDEYLKHVDPETDIIEFDTEEDKNKRDHKHKKGESMKKLNKNLEKNKKLLKDWDKEKNEKEHKKLIKV